MRVHVYRNLTKGCWSIKDAKTGRVVNHADNLKIYNAKFVVQKGGQERVRREKKKYVHAYVSGETDVSMNWGGVGQQVTYNPYTHDMFMCGDEPADNVYSMVSFGDSGKVFAYEEIR